MKFEEFEIIYRSTNYNIILNEKKNKQKFPFCINYEQFLEALLRISIKTISFFEKYVEKIKENNLLPDGGKNENIKLISPGNRSDDEEGKKEIFTKIKKIHFFDINNLEIINYDLEKMSVEILEAFIIFLGVSSNKTNNKIIDFRREIYNYLEPKTKNELSSFKKIIFIFMNISNICFFMKIRNNIICNLIIKFKIKFHVFLLS